MGTINKVSPDGGNTQYDIRDNNIAPVQLDTTAIKRYEVGDQFVLDSDGKTYKATQEIAQNGTIIIKPATGYNAELAGTVSEQLNTKMSYADNGVLGAQNLNEYPYYNTTKTQNNVTFTDLGDGRVQVQTTSAGASNNTDFTLHIYSAAEAKSFDGMCMSGCPQGGGENTFILIMQRNSSPWTVFGMDAGNGAVINSASASIDNNVFKIRIPTGAIITTPIIFKPMIALNKNMPYAPYAQTNRQLTVNKAETSVISEYVEDGATCKNPNGYSVGQHFQKNGKFCTCIANTAQNETWTLNTNYVEGTIADNMSPVVSDITTTTEGITLDSTFKQIVKVGNMCQFKLRFTCANDISEETTIATLPYIPITTKQLLWLEIHSLSVPYSAMDNSAYIYGNGRIRVYADATHKLLAGTYDISGIYMTKY